MPDNLGYTEGTGSSVATDEIDGLHHQRIKLGIGEDGTAVDVSKSNPMPVQDIRVEDLLVMINRLVKVCESLMVVDSAQRQRVTIDSITGNLVLTTVSNITTVNTVTTVGNQTTLAGMDREMYINIAKQTYALGIRSNLTFQ